MMMLGLLLVLFYYSRNVSPKKEEAMVVIPPVVQAQLPKPSRTLDGVFVENEKDIKPRVFAVMVENNIEAWPLSGLDSADVVYEVLAESRIPRFLTLSIVESAAEKLGPVRSARPYFVELAKPFDPIFMHVGGSPDGLKRIKSLDLIDFDEYFWGGKYFWRAKVRYAPHNTYTSKEMLQSILTDKEIENVSNFEGWKFKDPIVRNEQESAAFVEPKDIIINYTDNTYQARYVYDLKTNRYRRYQAKEPMKLLGGGEVWVDSVIVEEHPHKILDEVGRKEITLLGQGRAWIFRDGEVVKGTWSKKDNYNLTRYYDEKGDEISLNRGKIWINIVETNLFEYEVDKP